MTVRLLALALLAAPPQPPASPPCYDADEMADMAIVALPYVLEAGADRCRPHLAADSFLLGERGRSYRQQLREAGESRRASVIDAMRRVGVYDFPGGASDEERLESVLASFAAGTFEGITPVRCQATDSLMEALSPLAPSGIGLAFASIYGLVVLPPTSVQCPT